MSHSATTVGSHREAYRAVKAIAADAGDLPVYWGTGYAIAHPHVLAVNAHSEVRVTIYPTGDTYLGTDHTYITITVDRHA